MHTAAVNNDEFKWARFIIMGHVNNILPSWEKMYVVGSLIDFFLGRLHKNAKNNSSTQNTA